MDARLKTVATGVVLLSAVLAPAPLPAEVTDPNGVAVIVGNRNYRHERVPEVSYADRDAAAFKHFVTEVLGFDPVNVIELHDATQADLESAFGNERSHEGMLWRYLDPEGGSDVVVFYSGHGVPGLNDGRGYLLPVDAHPDTADINGYPIDVLYANLAKLEEEARSIAVYLDACFSGDSNAGMLVRSASPVYVRAELPETAGAKVTVLTAASGTELASWDDAAEHGLFTHHLLDALYGQGDADGDGQVTAEEAATYLKRYMTRAARRLFGRHQNATLLGAAETVLSATAGGAFPVVRPVLEMIVGSAAAGDAAQPARTTVEQDKYLLGMRRAHEAKDHGKVLEFWEKLAALAGEPPAAAEYYRGVAYAGSDRAEEANEALHRYLERAGQEGEHYEAALGLVLDVEEAMAAEAHRRQREMERKRPGQVFRDCDRCPELVVVPAGSYLMGSPWSEHGRDNDEGPQHRVTIGQPFAVGVYEVTFAEWDACVSAGGCGGYRPDDRGWGRGERPVINVSWDDVQGALRWLSRETGEEYRLLSESEWEYVARAGTTTPFHTGSTISTDQANYNGNYTYGFGRKGTYRRRTVPAGTFAANGFGLHDVHGNVREWTQDCWTGSYRGAPSDGSAWERGECGRRVVRGGSWSDVPRFLRSADRIEYDSGYRVPNLGFRVARTLTS